MSLALAGCLRGSIDVLLLDDGRGSIGVDLSVDRSKIPAFLGDPLDGVGTPQGLRRYTGPGIVAWAEPTRTRDGGWVTLSLRAFFDDVERLKFIRRRDEELVELLSFDREASELRFHHDAKPELAAPLPIPEREGSAVDADMIRGAVGMLRPMLGSLELSLSFTVPGPIEAAPGFRSIDGRTARVVAKRDAVLDALRESADRLIDADAFLAQNPTTLRWAERETDAAERARYDAARQAAGDWWEAHRPRPKKGERPE